MISYRYRWQSSISSQNRKLPWLVFLLSPLCCNYVRENLNARAGFRAVELAEYVESGDKSDEADAHDEHSCWSDLQAGRFIRVESEHITPRSGAAAADTSGAVWSASEPTATHAGCCRRRSAGGHHSRTWGCRGSWLRLRCASRHGLEALERSRLASTRVLSHRERERERNIRELIIRDI